MGKKRTRAKKTSRGLRASISRTTVRLVRDGRSDGDKLMNKLAAWRAGKKGWVTIPNSNPHETDRAFIKVTFDEYFGHGRDYKTVRAGATSFNKEADTTQ